MGGRHRQEKPFSRISETTAVPPGQKLLVRHWVRLNQQTTLVEIRRGDAVFAQDGVEVGFVAAIMLDCHHQEATHFLLGFLPPTAVYHLVPLSLINRIDEKTVWLKITTKGIEKLPKHKPDG